ncbi:HAD family hydrolase [Fusobacterium mortiferum]|uniref:hypothetical protein n=1 Tax=Fusobacterium mortiferum TaxID=850 RepID=UPI00356A46D7
MKVAIFDLDGTLYLKNSHIEILTEYYNTKFYKSIFFKIFYYIFPNKAQNLLNNRYNKIPDIYKKNFILPFRKSALCLFGELKNKGYEIIIISNAPIELIANAAKRLKVDFKRAEIGKKHLELGRNVDELIVCTDNLTDLELLKKAKYRYIYVNKKTSKFFKKNLVQENIFYMEE